MYSYIRGLGGRPPRWAPGVYMIEMYICDGGSPQRDPQKSDLLKLISLDCNE